MALDWSCTTLHRKDYTVVTEFHHVLFIVHDVNDFPNCTTSGESIMYADDTNIFLKHKSYEKLYLEANQQLSNIAKWLNCNKLTPNIKKTFLYSFSKAKYCTPSKFTYTLI